MAASLALDMDFQAMGEVLNALAFRLLDQEWMGSSSVTEDEFADSKNDALALAPLYLRSWHEDRGVGFIAPPPGGLFSWSKRDSPTGAVCPRSVRKIFYGPSRCLIAFGLGGIEICGRAHIGVHQNQVDAVFTSQSPGEQVGWQDVHEKVQMCCWWRKGPSGVR
jgi:hypothetical protein